MKNKNMESVVTAISRNFTYSLKLENIYTSLEKYNSYYCNYSLQEVYWGTILALVKHGTVNINVIEHKIIDGFVKILLDSVTKDDLELLMKAICIYSRYSRANLVGSFSDFFEDRYDGRR